MKAAKIILFVIAAFFLIFSFLLFLGSGGQGGSPVWITIGVILAALGFILIFFATRVKTQPDQPTNVTVNVDLPGNVDMDTIKCKSCGGTLSPEDIKMVAGAPVVTCPFCNTTYQLTEEPKW